MPRVADPDLADRIVRAAADLLQERGIEGVTMRAVAEAAGCSATTIYQRFTNKDELLHHAVVRGIEWMGADIGARMGAAAPQNGRERIAINSHAYVEWGIRNPAMYRLIFEQRLPTPAQGEELERRRSGWTRQRDLIASALAERPAGAPEVEADLAADVVFVSLHGVVSLAISGRLIGPAATQEQQLGHAHSIVDALVEQWATEWRLPG